MKITDINSCSFAAIDFETANNTRSSACAVGVAVVRQGKIVSLKRGLIRPPTRDFIHTRIHGLTWENVRSSPQFPQVWREITPAVVDVDFFAAHNAPFDRSVLSACCDYYQLPLPKQSFVCTVDVARSVFGIYPTKLSDVCQRLGISLDHHEAGSDAEACARILLAAAKRGWVPS